MGAVRRLSLLLLLGTLCCACAADSHFITPSVWGTDVTRIGLRGMQDQVVQIGAFEHTTMFGNSATAVTSCHGGYYMASQPVDAYQDGDSITHFTFTSSSPLSLGGLEKGKPAEVIAALVHSGLDDSPNLPSELKTWNATRCAITGSDLSVLQLLRYSSSSELEAFDPLVAFNGGSFVIHDTDWKRNGEEVQIAIAAEIMTPPNAYCSLNRESSDWNPGVQGGFLVQVNCNKDATEVKSVAVRPTQYPVVGVVNGTALLKKPSSYQAESLSLTGEGITVNSYIGQSGVYFLSGTSKSLTVTVNGVAQEECSMTGDSNSPTKFFTVRWENEDVTCTVADSEGPVASWFQDQVIKEENLRTLGFITPHEGATVSEGQTFSVGSCCIPVKEGITSFVATLDATDLSCKSILLFNDQNVLDQNARGTLLAADKWQNVDVVVGVDNTIELFQDQFSLSASVTNLPIMTLAFPDEDQPDRCSSSSSPATHTPTRTPTPTHSVGASASVSATISPSSSASRSLGAPVPAPAEYESNTVPDEDEEADSSSSWSGSDIFGTEETSKDNQTLSGVAMNKSWVTYVVFIVGILVVVGGVAGYLLMKKARTAVVSSRGRSGSTDERPLNRFSQMEEEYNHDV